MTASSWVFVAGLAAIVIAIAGIAAIAWPRRNTQTALGLLFAVIAVVSTINITLVGHNSRVFREEANRRITCLETQMQAVRAAARFPANSIPYC